MYGILFKGQSITIMGDVDLCISHADYLDMFENGWLPDWVEAIYTIVTDDEGLSQVVTLLDLIQDECGGVVVTDEEIKDDTIGTEG